MKQIKTGEYLIQEVPEDAGNYTLRTSMHTDSGSLSFYDKWTNEETIERIPRGQWQIVEPTEEVAREIVEQVHIYDFRGYKNYEDRIFPLDTALESYRSLLKANGIEQAILLKQIL